MFTLLFLLAIALASASTHDGKCPHPEGHPLVEHAERIIVVEDPNNPTQTVVSNGQNFFVERKELFPVIKTTLTGGQTHIADPGVGFHSVKTVPVSTKTFITEGQKTLVEKVEQPISHTVPVENKVVIERTEQVPVVKTIPVENKVVIQRTEQIPLVKTIPVENKVVVQRTEQFPTIQTFPVDVKTFVTGQKTFTNEIDVPVEQKFEGQKVVKVVHISKETSLQASPEAIKLGLSSGADELFGGAKIDASFSCHGKKYGYYADVRNLCKIYHICREVALADGTLWSQRNSFTCPIGTVFDQQKVSCVSPSVAMDCNQSELFYEHTAKLFATPVVEKKVILREAAPVKSCCVYPSCAYVFPCSS